MLDVFAEASSGDAPVTRSELARLMGKRPEQVTRLLGAPGNLTLDTVSDFFLAFGRTCNVEATMIEAQDTNNYCHYVYEAALDGLEARATVRSKTPQNRSGNWFVCSASDMKPSVKRSVMGQRAA